MPRRTRFCTVGVRASSARALRSSWPGFTRAHGLSGAARVADFRKVDRQEIDDAAEPPLSASSEHFGKVDVVGIDLDHAASSSLSGERAGRQEPSQSRNHCHAEPTNPATTDRAFRIMYIMLKASPRTLAYRSPQSPALLCQAKRSQPPQRAPRGLAATASSIVRSESCA